MGSNLKVAPPNVDLFCQRKEGEAGEGVDGLHFIAFEAFEGQEEFAGGQSWLSFKALQTHQVWEQ